MDHAITLAAIDLGSNSFRLEISRYQHRQIERMEYIKETVRQGNGLDAEGKLTPQSMERGWACLARFGERLRSADPRYVRAIATQTLREARNREDFVRKGSELLGFPIHIITGEEEAALIYRGVISQLPASDERRLVIDIGGRSTEFIVGQGSAAHTIGSYCIGSVAWTAQHFAQGTLNATCFARAEQAACAALQAMQQRFVPGSWDKAYASAGTVNAVGDVLQAHGHSPGMITRQGLDWLLQQLLRCGHVDRIKLHGLKEDRRPVLAGGLSVLRAIFSLLQLDAIHISQGALRMGVLHSLVNAHNPCDARSASIHSLMQRFTVDQPQAQRVAHTAEQLWLQLHPQQAQAPAALTAAGLLHEVGCSISHEQYHRHSAYILEHCTAAGMAAAEQQHLAQLLLGQRGKLKKMEAFMQRSDHAEQLLCLRLAVILCNARCTPVLRGVQLLRQGQRLLLQLPARWSQQFPRSLQLLQEEACALEKSAWTLSLSS